MDKYKVLEQIGSGSYSTVFKAIACQKNNELVALKRMKGTFKTWDECLKLREIQSLKGLQCANVVRLIEAVRENEELVLVFEFCEGSLHQAIVGQKAKGHDFSEAQVRGCVLQLLTALDYIHRKGYFHRDIKPENVLLNSEGVVKLSDFGLAREIRSRPPFTEYVSTRWYRAPENLLHSTAYNSPSDLWGVGAIMAEMFTRQPLFPGRSEADQVFKICSVLGTPDGTSWPKGLELAAQRGIRFPQVVRTSLSSLIGNASAAAINVMECMMQFDPAKRPSAAHCLAHDFFKGPTDKIQIQMLRVPSQAAPAPVRAAMYRAEIDAVGLYSKYSDQNTVPPAPNVQPVPPHSNPAQLTHAHTFLLPAATHECGTHGGGSPSKAAGAHRSAADSAAAELNRAHTSERAARHSTHRRKDEEPLLRKESSALNHSPPHAQPPHEALERGRSFRDVSLHSGADVQAQRHPPMSREAARDGSSASANASRLKPHARHLFDLPKDIVSAELTDLGIGGGLEDEDLAELFWQKTRSHDAGADCRSDGLAHAGSSPTRSAASQQAAQHRSHRSLGAHLAADAKPVDVLAHLISAAEPPLHAHDALEAAFPFGLAVSSSSLPKPSLKPVGDSDLALSGGDAVAVSLGSALDELDRFMRKH